jgi:hypothetical protein
MDPYTQYYLKQAKTGIGSISHSKQSGRGLGTFLSNVFKTVYPYVRSGFSAITNELLSGGIGLIKDTYDQVPVQESIGNRAKKVGHNLTDRAVDSVMGMAGSGNITSRKRKQKSQSVGRSTQSKKSKRGPRVVKKKKTIKNKTKKTRCPKKKTKKQRGKGFNDIFG